MALDFYFKKNHLAWNDKPRLGAIYAKTEDTIFLKPQEFYNESGPVIQRFMHYYKIPASDILVICDNFDLEFGKIRYRSSGIAGGNNGLKSIDAALGTPDYPRIRIGTKNDDIRAKVGDIDFVLSKFTPEEKLTLPEILNETAAKIDDFIN